jgi:hypothetical protein
VIKLHRALLAGALLTLASVSAQAASLNGGLPMASFGKVTNTGADLSVGSSPVVTAANTQVNGPGDGDFSGVALGALFGPNTVDTTNLSSFTLSNATYGSFSATNGSIISQKADFLDVFYVGFFTGIGGIPSGPASVRVSINLSGKTYSEAITLHAPPAVVPEPASAVMAGLGVLSIGLLSVRRKRAAS